MDAEELIQPDYEQCQAEKPNGNTFMTLGGVPGHVRCTNKPTVLATERKADKDGVKGSMTLCHDCWRVLLDQLGKDYADFEPIGRGGK